MGRLEDFYALSVVLLNVTIITLLQLRLKARVSLYRLKNITPCTGTHSLDNANWDPFFFLSLLPHCVSSK